MRDPHPQDLQKACIGFIKSLKAPASWHAVQGETAVNRGTGEVHQAIIIHRHPINASAEFKAKVLPDEFGGYPVIERPWPNQDL